jgi:hypothetical protein
MVSLIFTRIKLYITKVSLPVKGGRGKRKGYPDEGKSGFAQRLKGSWGKKERAVISMLGSFPLGPMGKPALPFTIPGRFT